MGDWESIFKKQGRVFLKPQEDMRKVIRLLKKQGVKRVLDLGCGTGRHTIMLAKAGFDVYGTDVSKEGLKLTRKWLKGLKDLADALRENLISLEGKGRKETIEIGAVALARKILQKAGFVEGKKHEE